MDDDTFIDKRWLPVATGSCVLLVLGAGVDIRLGGVGPAEIGLVALGALALWSASRRSMPLTACPFPVFGFLGVLVAACVAAGLSINGVKESAQAGGCLLVGFLAGHMLDGERRVRRVFVSGLSVVLVLNLLAAAWQAAYSSSDPLQSGLDAVRGLQRSHLQFAGFVVIALPVYLLFLSRQSRWLFWAGATGALALLGLTVLPIQVSLLLAVQASVALAMLAPGGLKSRLLAPAIVGVALLLGGFRRPQREGVPSRWDFVSPLLVTSQGATLPKRLTTEVAAAVRCSPRKWVGYGPGSYVSAVAKATAEAGLAKPFQARVHRDGNPQVLVTLVECGLGAAILFVCWLAGATVLALARSRGNPEAGAWPGTLALCGLGLVGVSCLLTGVLTSGLGPLVGMVVSAGWCCQRPTETPPTALRRTVTGLVFALLLGVVAGSLLRGPEKRAVHLRPEPAVWGVQPVSSVPTGSVVAGVGRGRAPADMVVIEAEDAVRVPPEWRVRPANNSSRRAVLTVPAGIGKGVGEAEFEASSPAAGEYRVWLRVLWEGGCANSIVVHVDGNAPETLEDAIFERWHWVDAASGRLIRLPEGPFRLSLRNTEDGVHVDQIAFLRDVDAVPAGMLNGPDAPQEKQLPTPVLNFDEEALPEETPFDRYGDEP